MEYRGSFMLTNYGYSDASGEYFITIDTDICDGCAACTISCPWGLFMVMDEDPNDPLREEPVAVIKSEKATKLNYECAQCKPSINRTPLPCVLACEKGAISHSW
jgi:Fe-S-cluster-containing dehydrogenase component